MKKVKSMVSLLVLICLITNVIFLKNVFMISAAASQVKINIKINNLDVEKKTVSIEKGKNRRLKVVVPRNQKAEITFRTNKSNIVSVSKTGKLNAKNIGSAKVIVNVSIKKKKYTSWVKIKVISSDKDVMPSAIPTEAPTITPTEIPTKTPSESPSGLPMVTPEVTPSDLPEVSPMPTEAPAVVPFDSPELDSDEESDMYDVTFNINGQSFSAKLYKTETTDMLMQKLPLSITMNELNGNEKYYYFSESFPIASERISEIKAGDIKLYGSSCLVLFYKSFSTSYSYTSLGYIENPEILDEVLGTGNVQVDITGSL